MGEHFATNIAPFLGTIRYPFTKVCLSRWCSELPVFRRICYLFFEEGAFNLDPKQRSKPAIHFFLAGQSGLLQKNQGLLICLTFRDLFFGFLNESLLGAWKKYGNSPFFVMFKEDRLQPREKKSQDHGPKGRQLWLHSMGQNSTVLDTPRAVVVPGRPDGQDDFPLSICRGWAPGLYMSELRHLRWFSWICLGVKWKIG